MKRTCQRERCEVAISSDRNLNTKYCSVACGRSEWRRKRRAVPRVWVCERGGCEVDISDRNPNTKYCSIPCATIMLKEQQAKWREKHPKRIIKPMGERFCEYEECEVDISDKRSDARFCSKKHGSRQWDVDHPGWKEQWNTENPGYQHQWYLEKRTLSNDTYMIICNGVLAEWYLDPNKREFSPTGDLDYYGNTTRGAETRWEEWLRDLKTNKEAWLRGEKIPKSINPYLQAVYNDYGPEVFEFILLHEGWGQIGEASDMEMTWARSDPNAANIKGVETPL